MSVQAMTWALTQKTITDASTRHVLLCLANYAGADGRGAFPSVETLCADTGLSERTIRYKLDALEEKGVIVRGSQAIAAAYIGRADKRPTVYDIVMRRGADAAPRDERGAHEDTTGCKSQQNGVQTTTERGAAVAPNPSTNPPTDPSSNQKARTPRQPRDPGFDASTINLPDWLDRADWARWVADRKERRKPVTEAAAALQVQQLDEFRHLGHKPSAVINNSIASGYQKLVAPYLPRGGSTGNAQGRFDPVAHMNRTKEGDGYDDGRTIDV